MELAWTCRNQQRDRAIQNAILQAKYELGILHYLVTTAGYSFNARFGAFVQYISASS